MIQEKKPVLTPTNRPMISFYTVCKICFSKSQFIELGRTNKSFKHFFYRVFLFKVFQFSCNTYFVCLIMFLPYSLTKYLSFKIK